MQFHVGPIVYTLIVSDRRIYDEEGNELEGRALEGPRVILLSRCVEPGRREEVAFHEYLHCWEFAVPRPRTDEERCNLAALARNQFNVDLEAQGGPAVLLSLPTTATPAFGSPAPAKQAPSARESFGPGDRRVCGACGAEMMCGSIGNGEPAFHEATRQVRIERWMQCDACGALQVWQELCTPGGDPLGEYVSNPPPRLLFGAEASQWIAGKRQLRELVESV